MKWQFFLLVKRNFNEFSFKKYNFNEFLLCNLLFWRNILDSHLYIGVQIYFISKKNVHGVVYILNFNYTVRGKRIERCES